MESVSRGLVCERRLGFPHSRFYIAKSFHMIAVFFSRCLFRIKCFSCMKVIGNRFYEGSKSVLCMEMSK